MRLKRLEDALRHCWGRDTCHPPLRKNWSSDNPAEGQCLPSAFIVQDFFGGEIPSCEKPRHYWNYIKGKHVDTTRS